MQGATRSTACSLVFANSRAGPIASRDPRGCKHERWKQQSAAAHRRPPRTCAIAQEHAPSADCPGRTLCLRTRSSPRNRLRPGANTPIAGCRADAWAYRNARLPRHSELPGDREAQPLQRQTSRLGRSSDGRSLHAKAVVAGIRWPACNGLAPGDSASARSCLPRPADQQAPELDGSAAASFREGARTPADSATPATAPERFSAGAARGGSVRGTVHASDVCLPGSSSTAYE
jgi:hypothetical protein